MCIQHISVGRDRFQYIARALLCLYQDLSFLSGTQRSEAWSGGLHSQVALQGRFHDEFSF